MWSNFNYYGLIVGLATVGAIWWFERQARRVGVVFRRSNLAWLVILSLAVVGARLWHVGTDWGLYQDNWLEAFKIWRGGLSIFGGLAGLVVGMGLVAWREKISWWLLLDLTALVLPLAQALGRWGNYFNQELYGPVTTLPWGVWVDGQRRHPLFLYESLLMLGWGLGVNWWYRTKRLGEGKAFRSYLVFYLGIRLGLDFLRPEKAMFNRWLGLNQFIIIGVLILIIGSWGYHRYAQKH